MSGVHSTGVDAVLDEIFVLGRLYDSQRSGMRRSLCLEKEIIPFTGSSGIKQEIVRWEAQWTNKIPSDTGWDLRATNTDRTSALEGLRRRLEENTARDSGKHGVK